MLSFAARAAIDDGGDKIVYQMTNGCSLVLTGPSAAAQSTTLITSSLPCTMQMQSLSADGSTVLFVSSDNFNGSNSAGLPECWLVDTASQKITAVGHDPAGIAEATMSGDRTIVWATTFAGRLTRTSRSTGATQEIIPQTVAVDQDPVFPLRAAAGALVHLSSPHRTWSSSTVGYIIGLLGYDSQWSPIIGGWAAITAALHISCGYRLPGSMGDAGYTRTDAGGDSITV